MGGNGPRVYWMAGNYPAANGPGYLIQVREGEGQGHPGPISSSHILPVEGPGKGLVHLNPTLHQCNSQ